MKRQRDYRAEYARRQERARAQGYTGYREQREFRAAGKPLPTDATAAPPRQRRVIESEAGTMIRGKDGPALRRSLDARSDLDVRVVYVVTTDGRRIGLFKNGGTVETLLNGAANYGGLSAYLAAILAATSYAGGTDVEIARIEVWAA